MDRLSQLREEFQNFWAKPDNYLMGGMLPVLEIEAGCSASVGIELDLGEIPPTPEPRIRVVNNGPRMRIRNRKSEEYTDPAIGAKPTFNRRNGRGRLG